MAWVAVSLLLFGWLAGAALIFGSGGSNLYGNLFFWSHFGAFVIGISSLERLGGIAAGIAAITLIACLALATGPMSAG